MDTILSFFGLIIFIIILIPFLGIAFLIFYVIKKSTEKKTPEFLQNEKIKMEEKVNDLKKDIENWKNYSPKDITNNLKYSFVKGMSNRLTGQIFSQDDSPIIAFQRIDRGVYVNSRIVASTTDFKIYFEYKNNEKLFFFDDLYLGKIINNLVILDSSDRKIGNCNRNNSDSQISYTIEFQSKKVAEINKNSDRKAFVKNILYKPHTSSTNRKFSTKYREVGPSYSLINSINIVDHEELKWIIAIAIFESIYYGFDFTS
jgi:hypothetical protein